MTNVESGNRISVPPDGRAKQPINRVENLIKLPRLAPPLPHEEKAGNVFKRVATREATNSDGAPIKRHSPSASADYEPSLWRNERGQLSIHCPFAVILPPRWILFRNFNLKGLKISRDGFFFPFSRIFLFQSDAKDLFDIFFHHNDLCNDPCNDLSGGDGVLSRLLRDQR